MLFKTKFHFVCTNKLEVELLEECGCRNILISYAFADRVMANKSLSWVRNKFDTIFVDSGAHTAFTQGREVDFDKYNTFLKKEKPNIDVAAQLDIIGNRERTRDNYIRHTKEGTDWVIPILSGHWKMALAMMEKHLVTDYLGLGGSQYWKTRYDQWNQVRTLPSKYKYHGFAKGNFEAFKGGWLYSIDSSSWSFGARGRETAARINQENLGISLGRKSKTARNDLRRVLYLLKDDLEATNTDPQLVIDGDYKTLLKIAIVVYYRPLFRECRMFNENFKFKIAMYVINLLYRKNIIV